MVTSAVNPYAADLEYVEPLKRAALERGGNEPLIKYLALDAAMGRNVATHNASLEGGPPLLTYPTAAEFLLIHGQAFTPPTRPRPKGMRKGSDKQCFSNATNAAYWDNHRYVEGYATSFIPVHHAWVLDGDGTLIETTWAKPGDAYFGVVFPQDIVDLSMLLTGFYGVFNRFLMEEPYTEDGYRERLKAARAAGIKLRRPF